MNRATDRVSRPRLFGFMARAVASILAASLVCYSTCGSDPRGHLCQLQSYIKCRSQHWAINRRWRRISFDANRRLSIQLSNSSSSRQKRHAATSVALLFLARASLRGHCRGVVTFSSHHYAGSTTGRLRRRGQQSANSLARHLSLATVR